MSNKIQIPFLVWGGNRNLNIEINNKYLGKKEIESFLEWSKKWGDNPKFGNFIESGGVSWLNTPIPNSEYRLHIHPFFVQRDHERPAFYFVGFFFTKDNLSKFSNFFSLIDALQSKELNDIIRLASDTIIIEVNNDNNNLNEFNNDKSESLKGRVFKGDYLKLKDELKDYLNTKIMDWFEEIAIACNPPDEDERLSTLIITDKFYHQGLRIIKNEPRMERPVQIKNNLSDKQENKKNIAEKKGKRQRMQPFLLTILIALTILIFYGYKYYNKNNEYNMLSLFLSNCPKHVSSLTLSFGQIETLIGKKLPQESNQPQWWDDSERKQNTPQAKAWLCSGFKVNKINILERWVEFIRIDKIN